MDGSTKSKQRRRGGVVALIAAQVVLAVMLVLIGLVPAWRVCWPLAIPTAASLVLITRLSRGAWSSHQRERYHAHLKRILDMMPAMVFFKDHHNRLMGINRAFTECTGLAAAQDVLFHAEPVDPADFCKEPGQLRAYHRDDAEVLSTGQPKRGIIEPLLTDPDRWFLTDKYLYQDEDGRPLGVLGFSTEITDRLAMEEAHRREKDFAERLIETAQAIILVLDTAGRIVRFNPFMEKLTGYRLEEVRGKDWFNTFIPPDRRDDVRALFGCAVRSEPVQGYVDRLLRKDGSTCDIAWHGATLPDASGEVAGVLAIGYDVTSSRQAEEKLRASLQEKEILLREIHHRVRNNLQTIMSLLNLHSHNVNDERGAEVLRESMLRVKSMALVHEGLYQAGSVMRFNLGTYIRTWVNELLQSFGPSEPQVALQLELDDAYLDVDAAMPCALIVNELVSNALKHAFPDGRAGVMRVVLHADDAEYCLKVCDNGVGLPSDFVFPGEGSLGLQLVAALVQQLRGTIHCHCEGGTSFEVCFPRPVVRNDTGRE